MKYLLIALAGFLTTANEAWAWGDTGHKIVCEIAIRLVKPETRSRIGQIMAEDSESQSFVDACTWPDHPRKRAAEHFLNLPRNAGGLGATDCGEAAGCVVTAINRDFAVLASNSTDAAAKRAALKYLSHWVGDVHQPLHVSFADDRGGNDIRVTGECSPNLHSAWDTCLVLKAVGDDTQAAIAEFLKTLTPEQRNRWVAGSARDWANESFAISRRPETRYCTWLGDACVRSMEGVRIDRAYLDTNLPVVREQLLKAGVRLAQLLDRALTP